MIPEVCPECGGDRFVTSRYRAQGMVTLKTNCQGCGLLVATAAPEPERRSLLDELGLGALREWFGPRPVPRADKGAALPAAEDRYEGYEGYEDEPPRQAGPVDQGPWEGDAPTAPAGDWGADEAVGEPAPPSLPSSDEAETHGDYRETEPRWELAPDAVDGTRETAPVTKDTTLRGDSVATTPLAYDAVDTEEQTAAHLARARGAAVPDDTAPALLPTGADPAADGRCTKPS